MGWWVGVVNISQSRVPRALKLNIMLTDSQIAATHAQSPVASNIKIIPFAETIAISTYDNRHQFIRVATVLLDNDITPSGKKRRNTVIKFAPAIAQDAFKEKTESPVNLPPKKITFDKTMIQKFFLMQNKKTED